MFFEISKFFYFFLSPITWIILLLVLFFKIKRSNARKACLIISIVFFVIFTNGLLINHMRYEMGKPYSKVQVEDSKTYKVAIIMGGFSTINETTGQLQYIEDRADRLWEAIRLWRNGQIEKILITGDPTSIINQKGESDTHFFLNYMEQIGVPPEIFILEQHAKNTRQNALYTAKILQEFNISDKDCLLITSATHMKRSLGCFAKVGIYPNYFSVNNYEKPSNISHRSFYPNWGTAVKWEELLNEWIGEITYKIMGYM